MWKYPNDKTKSVLTAEKHIEGCHKSKCGSLPRTAVLFYMHSGVAYAKKHYACELITENFPSFLNARPVYKVKEADVCFLHGGWGAPMAADTVETLFALGVRNIVSVGMCGSFSQRLESGDILIPDKAYAEEGTSLHYYENADCFYPCEGLRKKALSCIDGAKSLPIVSVDAVYRQTFFKEQKWREEGAVGVDMETSALFSVGKYLGLNVLSVLIASDKHPLTEQEGAWQWTMTEKIRYNFFAACIGFALQIE